MLAMAEAASTLSPPRGVELQQLITPRIHSGYAVGHAQLALVRRPHVGLLAIGHRLPPGPSFLCEPSAMKHKTNYMVGEAPVFLTS